MAVRGQFSIEWLSQSSQGLGSQCLPVSPSNDGPSASGTHSESLPGFYSTASPVNQDHQEGRGPSSHTDSERVTNHQSPRFPNSQQVVPTGFSSGTEEETSGYESEGGHSLSPSASLDCISPPPLSPPSGRRPRTAFTTEQIKSLEKAFKRNAYLGTQDKAELCKKLSLSDKQIRNWFQNRRMKLKRTVQDALAHACQAKVASHLLHYSELQAFCPGPYPSYHSHLVPEGPTTATYLQPHNIHYTSASASLTPPGGSNPPLDSLYQYAALPGFIVPSSSASLMGAYQPYPHQY